MDLTNLRPAKGAVKGRRIRIGRGEGSGKGGTATRGHKGAKSRSGYSKKIGFEGGQNPLQRRVPKFGFTNINRKEFKGINLDTIQHIAESNNIDRVDIDVLIEKGYISKNALVKVLGRGTLESKIDVVVHAYSKSAKEAIEAKGGTAETL